MLPVREFLEKRVNAVLSAFYPEVCTLCGKRPAGPDLNYVCAQCRSEVEPVKEPCCETCGNPIQGTASHAFTCANCRDADLSYDSARSAVMARARMRDAVHKFKYNAALWLEPYLAGILVQHAVPAIQAMGGIDLIVPVPLHSTKQRERGFNQAERLGDALSKALNVPLAAGALRRRISTPSQTNLGRQERQDNVRDAFVPGHVLATGLRVLLVDDVFTTGATTNECAKVLKTCGASCVHVWTLARADDAFTAISTSQITA